MTSKTVTYRGVGIRTTRSVHGMSLFLGLLAWNSILSYELRTHDHVRAVLAVLWVIYVAISTYRALSRLSALEEEQPDPDDAMNLAFQLVRVQPILGTVPLIVCIWLAGLH